MLQEDQRSSVCRVDTVPTLISWVGGLLFLAFIGEWVVFNGLRVEPLLTANFVLSLVLSLVFSAGLIYAGYRIEQSALPDDRYPRIGKWFAGGMTLFFLVNAPMIVVWHPGTVQGAVGWARISIAMGGIGGVIFGSIEARAIQRELAAERASVRAEEAETQRQWFDYMNALLRHEVLNTTQVITGFAAKNLNGKDLADDVQSDLETIHQRAQDMSKVIQDVQVLIQATKSDAHLKRMNLAELVATELEGLDRSSEPVEITASIPENAWVMADDLLPRVFANLFMNAVQHNDSETPQVDVTVEVEADTVIVSVADNGPGVPESERDTLFERNEKTDSTHGLGLYLVRTLVERYDGTVRLSETGTDGSVFAVELPRATAEASDSVSSTVGVRSKPA